MSRASDEAGQPSNPTCYYRPLAADRFESTAAATGAWDVAHQHMSPVTGLLVDAIERCAPRPELALSRVTFDILGVIAGGEVAVSTEVVRPGRTIELVQAHLTVAGRTAVRATAWRLATSTTDRFAATTLAPMPGPEVAAPLRLDQTWDSGYVRSVETRALPGRRRGHARVWVRSRLELICGAEVSALARLLTYVDIANGVSVSADPTLLAFPNLDLTIHLFRQPHGEWLGLDTEVSLGSDGTGLTAAVLYDTDGPFGRSAQTLTLRPR